MNPSAAGWIQKYGHMLDEGSKTYPDFCTLYRAMRDNGFIYGVHLDYPNFIEVEHKLTEDEIAKVNLLTALYFVFKFERKTDDFEAFVTTALDYYKQMQLGKLNMFEKLFTGKTASSKLEKIIGSRVHVDDSLLSRTIGSSLTNSLLFIDAFIFIKFLEKGTYALEHARLLEFLTINLVYHALKAKETNKKDEKLAQLLYSSLTYIEFDGTAFDGSYRDLLNHDISGWEKDFLLDIACLAVWEDQSLDYLESEFIFGIGKDLGKTDEEIVLALSSVKTFFEKNKKKIPHLVDKNLATQFYDGMSKNVSKLILRNSKRLMREFSESKELVSLLAKSTTQDLSKSERKKMQNQLLDIFKTIPSLAIFLLPGGAVLLPLFVKLIPTLLPSAFDDNRIEKKTKK